MLIAYVNRGILPGVAWKIVLKNVIFPEVMEKASKKIEKKCYSSRKEFRK